MNWIDKLERKYRHFGIQGLMKYIVALSGVVFLIKYTFPESSFDSYLAMVPSAIMRGEVWRLFSYIIIPPDYSLFGIIGLYFYYIIGANLENVWGTFKFNLYYFLGMVGTTLAAFATGGYTTATYLSLSLFLAYAKLFPEEQILLFFILPIKIKYLGWIYWISIGFTILTAPLSAKIAAIVSIINYFVFFGRETIDDIRLRKNVFGNRNDFRKKSHTEKKSIHKCTVCGITEKDNPDMEFRYCSECDGAHEYCMNHLRNHAHIKYKN